MRARLYAAPRPLVAERERVEARYAPSVREAFPTLRDRLIKSRPVVGQQRGAYKVDKSGRKRYRGKPTPILGAPTFRNAIVDGRHV